MRAQGRSGSVVPMLCDAGERYLDTYYDPDWLVSHGFDIKPWCHQIENFIKTGTLKPSNLSAP